MGENHDHEHEHEHEHCHEHDHDHDHHHDHHHDNPAPRNKEQVVALLDYMCKHNASHEEELGKLIDALRELGNDSEADKVSDAKKAFAEGNAALREALFSIKEV